MHQSIEALFYSEDFPSVSDGCFNRGADDRIQSGTIAATGENSDSHAEIVLDQSVFSKVFHRDCQGGSLK
jgi:hypothetical protein